jgi:site-specific DNA-cytosine methylase
MDRPLRVFDLFSGLNSRGDPFREAGHEVFAIDIDQRFDADAYLDIGDVAAVLETVPWRPDLIFASPPCRSFSMMQASAWRHDNEPRKPAAFEGRHLVLATLRIMAALRPESWVVENPRARLRSVGLMDGFERRTVWMCRLGLDRAKPTDLWGVFPDGLELPPEC